MSAGNPVSIPVALGDRSYEVLIGRGLLARSVGLIGQHVGPLTDALIAGELLPALEAIDPKQQDAAP